MINKNWARWIKASCVKYFYDLAVLNSLNVFVEGAVRDTDELQSWIEIRVDGPNIKEVSSGVFICTGQVDILCNVIQSDSSNIYTTDTLNGLVQSFFGDICVYRYGNGPDDAQTLLETYKLTEDFGVRTNYFGQSSKNAQSSVEGNYKMVLIP